jgi:stalled ribosome alternative rescue factor ArfA
LAERRLTKELLCRKSSFGKLFLPKVCPRKKIGKGSFDRKSIFEKAFGQMIHFIFGQFGQTSFG